MPRRPDSCSKHRVPQNLEGVALRLGLPGAAPQAGVEARRLSDEPQRGDLCAAKVLGIPRFSCRESGAKGAASDGSFLGYRPAAVEKPDIALIDDMAPGATLGELIGVAICLALPPSRPARFDVSLSGVSAGLRRDKGARLEVRPERAPEVRPQVRLPHRIGLAILKASERA